MPHTSMMVTVTVNAVMGSMNTVMDLSTVHLRNPAIRSDDRGDGMTLLTITGHLQPPLLGRPQQAHSLAQFRAQRWSLFPHE